MGVDLGPLRQHLETLLRVERDIHSLLRLGLMSEAEHLTKSPNPYVRDLALGMLALSKSYGPVLRAADSARALIGLEKAQQEAEKENP